MAIAAPPTIQTENSDEVTNLYLERICGYVKGKNAKELKTTLEKEGLTWIVGQGKGYVFNGSPAGLRLPITDGKVADVNYVYVDPKILALWRAGNRSFPFMPNVLDPKDLREYHIILTNQKSYQNLEQVFGKVQ